MFIVFFILKSRILHLCFTKFYVSVLFKLIYAIIYVLYIIKF